MLSLLLFLLLFEPLLALLVELVVTVALECFADLRLVKQDCVVHRVRVENCALFVPARQWCSYDVEVRCAVADVFSEAVVLVVV